MSDAHESPIDKHARVREKLAHLQTRVPTMVWRLSSPWFYGWNPNAERFHLLISTWAPHFEVWRRHTPSEPPLRKTHDALVQVALPIETPFEQVVDLAVEAYLGLV